jgi:hypothetical protein
MNGRPRNCIRTIAVDLSIPLGCYLKRLPELFNEVAVGNLPRLAQPKLCIT